MIDGTINVHWDRAAFGPRTFYGAWAPLDDSDWESVEGTWNGGTRTYFGEIWNHPDFENGTFEAQWSGRNVTIARDNGFGVGVRSWIGNGRGYFATIYGTCVPPEVTSDLYEFVGNTPLVVGRGSYGWGETTAAYGPLDNDLDGADLVVVGVTDGSTLCEITDFPASCSTAQGGEVYVYQDGTFEYFPPVSGPDWDSDHFDLVLEHLGTGAQTTSSVELSPSNAVWYLDTNGTGEGTLIQPASSLDALADRVMDGDVLWASGTIDGGDGVTLSGNIRVQSADQPLVLESALNGQPGPLALPPFGSRATLMAYSMPALIIDPDSAPTAVVIEGVDIFGSGGEGLIRVGGSASLALTVRDVTLEAITTGLMIDQPSADPSTPSAIVLEEVQFGGPMVAVAIRQGHHGNTALMLSGVEADTTAGIEAVVEDSAQLSVTLDETAFDTWQPATHFTVSGQSHTQVTHTASTVQGAEAAIAVEASEDATVDIAASTVEWTAERPLDLQLSGGTVTNISLSAIQILDAYEAIAIGTHEEAFVTLDMSQSGVTAHGGLRVVANEASTVRLVASELTIESDTEALALTNNTANSEGFQAYLGSNQLASFGNTSTVELYGFGTSTTHVTLLDNVLYNGGHRPALDVRSHHNAETALTLMDNAIQGDSYELIEVRTASPGSRMCFDMAANTVEFPGAVVLGQFFSSDFALPGLHTVGSGQNPSAVRAYLQSRNQTRSEIDMSGGHVVDFLGGQPCAHFWTL